MAQLNFQETKELMDVYIQAGVVPGLVGEAGIGKTQLVEKYARENNLKLEVITASTTKEGDIAIPRLVLNKEWKREDVRYALHHKIQEILDDDNRLKRYNNEYLELASKENLTDEEKAKKEECEEFIKTSPNGSLLFLDELNRASAETMAELMNLILQREIDGNYLPDSCVVVIAENPSSDMPGYEDTDYATTTSDTAIRDRIGWLFMEANTDNFVEFGQNKSDEWKELARAKSHMSEEEIEKINISENSKTRIHQSVLLYLIDHPDQLIFPNATEPNGNPSYVTPSPRSWDAASRVLKSLDLRNVELTTPLLITSLSGILGGTVGASFSKFVSGGSRPLPKIAPLFEKKSKGKIPEDFQVEIDSDKNARKLLLFNNVLL